MQGLCFLLPPGDDSGNEGACCILTFQDVYPPLSRPDKLSSWPKVSCHLPPSFSLRETEIPQAAFSLPSQMTFRVAVGDHNLSENDGAEQFVSVQKVVVHPSWSRNNVAAGYA